MSLEPWQTFLDSATQTAARDGFLNKIAKKNEEELVNACLEKEDLRLHLCKWMDNYLSSSKIEKSPEDSIKYRTMGNKKFKEHDDNGCLRLYSKSILVAPQDSEEYAVGFGNRSAVLYEMKLYEACSNDINMALKSQKCPKSILHKLLLRQARCLKQLRNFDECRAVIKTLLDHLESAEGDIPTKKLDDIHEEVDSILLMLDSPPWAQASPSLHSLIRSSQIVPQPKSGYSLNLPAASSCAELRCSQKKGRYVVATVPFNQGDVIFVEKPYVCVVLPNQYLNHCHHCCAKMHAPIPCATCCQALFCSKTCQYEALTEYHNFECGALPMMWSIGIAHLGLRTLLVTGTPAEVVKRAEDAAQYFRSNKHSVGNPDDPYCAVFGLMSHVEDMLPEDAFQYTLTAMLLTEYLLRRTSYFGEQSTAPEELLKKICAIILRHIAQLVCNAHALTKIDDIANSCIGGVVDESQQRIATGIYPCASMMNHSCDPNISNSFYKNMLVVKASRNIAAGEEVFNCYGPHRWRMSLGDRQMALQAQYFFSCECSACVQTCGEVDDTQDRGTALCCRECKGPLLASVPGRQPAGAKEASLSDTNPGDGNGDVAPPEGGADRGDSTVHRMICAQCGNSQSISSQVEGLFRARYLFSQALEAYQAGDVNVALSKFIECRDIQQRCLYRAHSELTNTLDHIAKCYAAFGRYNECIPIVWEVISAAEEHYGADSIEVAHELKKLSDVLLLDINSEISKNQKQKQSELKHVLERAKKILSSHYGQWDPSWQEIDTKLRSLELEK